MKSLIPPKANLKRELIGNQQIFWTDIFSLLFVVSLIVLIMLSTMHIIVKIVLCLFVIFISVFSFIKIQNKKLITHLCNLIIIKCSKNDFESDDRFLVAPITKIENSQYTFFGKEEENAIVLKVKKNSFNYCNDTEQTFLVGQLEKAYSVINSFTIIAIPEKIEISNSIQNYKDLAKFHKDSIMQEVATTGNACERSIACVSAVEDIKKELISKSNESEDIYTVENEMQYYIVVYKARLEDIYILQGLLEQAMIETEICDDKALVSLYKNCFTNNFDKYAIDKLKKEEYLDFVLPTKISTKLTSINYDDESYKVFYIKEYPKEVDTGWLATITSMSFVKTFIQNIKQKESDIRKLFEKASQIKELRMKKELRRSEQFQLNEENDSLNAVLYDMSLGKAMFSTNILFMVENNREAIDTFQKALRAQGFITENIILKSKSFPTNCSPCMDNNLQSFARFLSAETLANAYPFTGVKCVDTEGVYIGDDNNNIPFVFDNMLHRKSYLPQESDRINGNIAIFGETGSGKSYLNKKMIIGWMLEKQSKQLIFDIEDEYRPLGNRFGGLMLDVGGTNADDCINPLHIFPQLEEDSGDTKQEDVFKSDMEKLAEALGVPLKDVKYQAAKMSQNQINNQLVFLRAFHQLAIPEITTEENAILLDIISELYDKKGITNSTNIRNVKAKDFPVYADVYKQLESRFKKADKDKKTSDSILYRKLMNYIKEFTATGAYGHIWGKPTNLNLDNKLVILSFRSLLANKNVAVINAQLYLLMRYVELELIKNREYCETNGVVRPYRILIDEVQKLIDEQLPKAFEAIADLAVRVRKYNGCIIVSTQNIKNFKGTTALMNKASQNTLNAMQYKFILKLGQADIEDLMELFALSNNLTDYDAMLISQFARGECLCMLSPKRRVLLTVGQFDEKYMR